MRLHINLAILGLGLVGSALAEYYCCMPGCRVCVPGWKCGGDDGECGHKIFSTCCANEKKRSMIFLTEEEYLASVA